MGSKIGNTLAKITDYEALLKGKVLEQYKGKENWDKIISFFAEGFQEIEDMFWDLYIKRWLKDCEGKQLDNIGYNLSVDRQGLSDNDYRQIIFGKIGQYNSNGSINEIIKLIKALTNADLVLIKGLFPAKLSIGIIGDSLNLNEDFLESSIEGAMAAGVGTEIKVSKKTPVFAYAPEDGSPYRPSFKGYPAEDSSTVSYYAESL